VEGIGEGCNKEAFNTSDWEETGGSWFAFGNDGFDDGVGADGFAAFV